MSRNGHRFDEAEEVNRVKGVMALKATNKKAPNRFRKLNSNPKFSANSTYFAFLRLLHCNITLKKLNIWFSWVLNVDEESAVFTSFILARQS